MSNPTLPDWYGNSTVPEGRGRGRRIGTPVRRALAGFAQALSEELAAQDDRISLLGRIEPRAKIVAFIALVVGATLLHGILPLAVLLASLVALALWSGVGVGRLSRIWAGVPLFSLAIILPAIFNLVTAGRPLLVLWHSGAYLGRWALPGEVTITLAGVEIAARFMLRSVNCVTLTVMLVSTTEHALLLNALRRLGMPRVFGMVLAMMQRYLVLLLRSAEEIHLAKLSRSITTGPTRDEQRWVAAGIGILFRRTHRLAQEVNQAMISRGYDGDLRLRNMSRMRIFDYVAAGMGIAFAALLVVADRLI